MTRIYSIIWLILLFQWANPSWSQRISFGSDHVSENSRLRTWVATAIDTLKEKSGNVFSLFFVKNEDSRHNKVFDKRDPVNGWFSDPLTDDIELPAGVHALFIEFADTFTRAYNIFVNNSITNATSNIKERILLPINPQDFDDVSDSLIKKIKDSDSATFVNAIPAGLKAVLCLDMEAPKGFNGDDKEILCCVSQYLIKPPDHADIAGTDNFFRSFTGCSRLSPVYTLLSGGYQLTQESFDPAHLPNETDVFGGKKNYELISHPNANINTRVVMGYFASKFFRRILIYVNN